MSVNAPAKKRARSNQCLLGVFFSFLTFAGGGFAEEVNFDDHSGEASEESSDGAVVVVSSRKFRGGPFRPTGVSREQAHVWRVTSGYEALPGRAVATAISHNDQFVTGVNTISFGTVRGAVLVFSWAPRYSENSCAWIRAAATWLQIRGECHSEVCDRGVALRG